MAESKPEKFIRETATSMPEVEVGAVCDKVAFKAGKKNFLFLGSDGESYDVKLKDSLAEANDLPAGQAGTISVGPSGWVELEFPKHKSLPKAVLKRWIEGSFRLLVPNQFKTGRQLSQALPLG